MEEKYVYTYKNREHAKPGMKIYWTTTTILELEKGTIQSIDKSGNFSVIWHTMGDAYREYKASFWPFFRLDFEEQQYNDFLDKIKDRMDI